MGDDVMVRAFADDVGMVMKHSTSHVGRVMDIYKDLSLFSGLKLNLEKTVIIPLWDEAEDSPKEVLTKVCTDCKSMVYSNFGIYLGFAVGPGRNNHQWAKAADKYITRAYVWKESHQSLHYSAVIYNICVSTVLAYIWQLASPSDEVLTAESKAMAKLVPGPGMWVTTH
ncbi:MAG: hypothetical protein ACKPKO_16990, partial [Candidatus Fonsibacter sp.]